MNTIDCTIKLSDVQQLTELISQKILSNKVVCNYLCHTWDSFSINSREEVLVEWSVLYHQKDSKGIGSAYISFSKLLESLKKEDYILVCQRLVEDCERVFYDAYSEHSSDAFPLEFMMDKVRRLGL